MDSAMKKIADLLLLQKIERNMLALNGEIAKRMGRALARKIILEYNCNTVSECIEKLTKEIKCPQ